MAHDHDVFSLQRLLLALWISTLLACYEKLDLPDVSEDFCRPGDPMCASLDFDKDGVSNGIDSFPLDAKCSQRNHENCSACGKGCSNQQICNEDGKCIENLIESCNGIDDDLNGVIDDLKTMIVPLADLQQGVCADTPKICLGSQGWQNPNYLEKIEGYQEEESRCDGLDNDCDGAVDEKLNLPLAENQKGVCQGMTKLCVMNGYQEPDVSLASAYEAEDRSCNGLDNDCDGKIDEGYESVDCQSEQFGICKAGVSQCNDGTESCQSRLAPRDEQCNGMDDDCDGGIDETLNLPLASQQNGICQGMKKICKQADGYVDPIISSQALFEENDDSCNGLDNDCDGQIDEGFQNIDCETSSFGICKQGSLLCLNGQAQCNAYLQARPELCDGLDNDCDGATDESLNQPMASNQNGICLGLKKLCTLNGSYLEPNLNDLPLFEENDDSCNGLDNDCDGQIDEGFQNIDCETSSFGICKQGSLRCLNGQAQCNAYLQARPELCDGLDNDCDGLVDDQLIGFQATKQDGVCAGSKTLCQNGNFVEPNYTMILNYEAQEQSCDGLDNDCDRKVDESIDLPLDDLQVGVCIGARKLCSGLNGFTPTIYTEIQGYEVQEQSCDGLDNDCDGHVDEAVKNACGNCGLLPMETCDRLDNDCDGRTDEGLGGVQESCDGLDNDCDQRIDENLLLSPATLHQGVCETAWQTCQGLMGWKDPIYLQISNYQVSENRCDGLDNDCDGTVDEDVTEVLADLQDGVCLGAIKNCFFELGYLEPDYTEIHAYQANESLCDALDNDCDGFVDETLLNACGSCGVAPRELCDAVDNDCDGKIDEGVKNSCGACGVVPREICDSLDNDCDGHVDEGVKNACGACGVAPVENCDALDNDCDGNIDEGVKNACGLCDYLPTEECDLIDNDCDGKIDELVRNACGVCGDVPLETCDQRDNDCDGKVDEGVKNVCDLCGTVPSEICDGFDNDCDGQTDEFLLNACGRCGSVPVESCDGSDNDCDGFFDENLVMNLADKQDGVCVGQVKLCKGVLRIQEPNYSLIQGYEATEVTCDGLDNDCDRKLDEVFIPDADLKVGVCLGMKKECRGSLGILEPDYDAKIASYEVVEASCDHLDNDCDGRQDEGLQNCCGDGVVQALAGEYCDDGNSVDGDVCKNNCQLNYPCGANCPVMEMILIQAGSFNMGSNTSTNQQPIHNVQIRSNFYVGKTEVTVGQYRACVNAGQCTAPDGTVTSTYCNWTSSVGSKETHPVNCVDWNQARAYARWIGGDLLTEAQWEFVATAQGQAITYPWGNAVPTCQLANFYNNAYCVNPPNGSTAAVCSTTGGNTTQGVCDMGGNVWEWVLDEWHNSYSGAPANEQAWCSDIGVCNTNTSANRVIRGGGWSSGSASGLRSAARLAYSPGDRSDHLGFRVSRSVP